MNESLSVLIIDDEIEATALLALHFQRDGYQVYVAQNGPEGLRLAREHDPNVVVLDVRLPGMDGYQVCGELRDFSEAVILFTSAVNDREAIVRGLQLGADDFLTKPFNYLVLLARIEACLRRRSIQRERASVAHVPFTDWSLDADRREVRIGKRRVVLTPKEFEVLQYFMAHPDTVLASDDLLAKLWGPGYVGDPDLVKQFIYRLRSKLEPNPSEPQYFVTIRGSGYAFEPDTHEFHVPPDEELSRMPKADPVQLGDGPQALKKAQQSGVIILPPPDDSETVAGGREPSQGAGGVLEAPGAEPVLGFSIRALRDSNALQGWTITIPRSSAALWLGLAAIALLAGAALCRLALP